MSQASEGVLDATGPTGPTRAVLQCFAGPAQLASALVKQGYFSYGVDRVKHKSAMAPVLQMDLSSRSACDSVLTWLDKQKVAGVMLCIPRHSLSLRLWLLSMLSLQAAWNTICRSSLKELRHHSFGGVGTTPCGAVAIS